MYWADITSDTIRRANLDGTNIETLWAGIQVDRPAGIALDTTAGKMYWTDYGRDKIMRANLDGSSVEALIDLFSSADDSRAYSLSVDARAGKMYFSDITRKTIYRADLDGSGLVAIAIRRSLKPPRYRPSIPNVSVSPSTGLFTSESGGAATFQVALTTPPTGQRDDSRQLQQFARRDRLGLEPHLHAGQLERAADGHGHRRR